MTLVACGASHPSVDPSATSFSAERAPTEADAAAREPVAEAGPPDIDASTAKGAGAFLDELCTRAATGDDAWLGLHLSARIRSSVVVRGTKDGVQLGALGHEPAAARQRLLGEDGAAVPPCSILLHASLGGFEADSGYASGRAHAERGEYRWVVDLASTHPQLAELAWQLPQHPLPAAAATTKRPFAVEGSVLDPWADKSTSTELTTLVDALRAEPRCLFEEAARTPSSPIVIVAATKTDGTPATAHVYPSAEPVSQSLLACLETQLTAVANDKLKARRYAIEGVLRIFLDPRTMPKKTFSFSGTKPSP